MAGGIGSIGNGGFGLNGATSLGGAGTTTYNPVPSATPAPVTTNVPGTATAPAPAPAPATSIPITPTQPGDTILPEISVTTAPPPPSTAPPSGASAGSQYNVPIPGSSPSDNSRGGGTGAPNGGNPGSSPGTDGPGSGAGGSTDMGSSGGSTTPTFYDNALNGYRQVAYHFRLYCAGDRGDSNSTQVIVAETGKTGFNVREVHIEGYVAPNPATHNTRATTFTMVITEPMGVAFLDALYVSAAASGVKNWNTCMYLLDLWFVGYNEDGSVANPITQNMPNNGKMTWRFVITELDTVLETSGAVYTLKCQIIHDSIMAPEWLGTQSNLTVTGKTVQEHLDNLANQVNKKILADYKKQIVLYKFQFHGGGQSSGPNPAQFQLKAKTTQMYDPYRLFSMTEKTRDDATANYSRGQYLTTIVDALIGSTEDGQSLAWYGKTGGDLTKQPDSKFTETIHYQVYPEVKYTGEYNETYGQYLKEVVLHVKPYKTQATVRNSQEIKDAGQAAWSAATPRTHKKYEYIFTGLNTEVINFEPKFTMYWSAAMPRFAGWEQTNEMVEHHAIYDKVGAEKFKAYRGAQANAAAGAQQVTAGQQQTGLASVLGTGNLGALGTNAFQNALRNTIAGNVQGAFSGTPASATPLAVFTGAGGSSGGGAVAVRSDGLTQISAGNILASKSEADLQAQQAALKVAQQQSGQYANVKSGTFAEDLLGSGPNGSLPYTPLTLAQAASAPTRANGTGVLGQRGTIGRSVYGAMLDQLYDSTTYLNVDLQVRGDPFWLGGQYENNFQDVSSDKNAADFSQGDTCFALVFKYPYGLDEATGQPNFKPQNTFNGAYRAWKVMSDFVDGKFTQTISAIRMVKVRPDDVNKAVAGASSSASGGTSSSTSPSTTGSTGASTPGSDGATTNSGTVTATTAAPATPPVPGTTTLSLGGPGFNSSGPAIQTPPLTIGNTGGATSFGAFSPTAFSTPPAS